MNLSLAREPERVARAALGRAAFALAVLAAGCSPSPRDVVPESRDVRATPRTDVGEAYAYVARRPHGTVALAEARHMSAADARSLVERVANELERCASSLERRGLLVDGAIRIVAVAGPNGTPALNVRLAPGDAAMQNALLCIVAPMRAATLPAPTAEGPPGLAIEATWGPTAKHLDDGSDAGGTL